MKKIFSKSVFCFLVCAQVAFAGDASELKIIGFSKEGKHLAFEVSGVQDGSGIPYREVYFVDVEQNDYLTSPMRFRGREGDGQSLGALRKQSEVEIAELLQLYRIDRDVQGQTLVYHPLSDLTGDGCHVRFSVFPGVFPPPSRYKYELFLEQKPTGDTCYELEAKIFTLKLRQGEMTKILQKDTRLPASRGCVYRYRIERVVMFERRIAVFLNIFQPGFEGPAIRHMVVTGSLEFE